MAPTVPRRSSKMSEQASSQGKKSASAKPDLSGGDFEFNRVNRLLKPDDQEQLTEAQLQEEIARQLTTQNPRVQDSLVDWSWFLREFVKKPNVPNIITALDIPGSLLYKERDEAKRSLDGDKIDDGEEPEKNQVEQIAEEAQEEDDIEPEEEDESKTAQDTAEPDEDEEEKVPSKPKKVINQFNYCERAALTYSNHTRDMTSQTVPPPTDNYNTNVYQWTIYDAYQEDYSHQKRGREKDKKAPPSQQQKNEDSKKKTQVDNAAMTHRMLKAIKTLERMVNQNIFDEIAQDYRYWNDPSDEFKEGEGSLLPLWKFTYEKVKKLHVTDLCFNPLYYDLIAASFGTMTFDSSLTYGSVCLFTLKNPSHPEWICSTESPVITLAFHPENAQLLVIGCMDGSVAVYNILTPVATPQYVINDVTQKHAGIIWQVRWGPSTEEGNLTFFSIGIDGKIKHWVLNQNDLGVTTIMTLFLHQDPVSGPDGTLINLKACGTCVTFHPDDSNVFFVGTEEGHIYKCNTAYSSVYMKTYYEAHNMPVYRIDFNKFNSKIFASCSGDWRIKIWEDDRLEPLFMFDLGIPIGDVKWAPYSSTVLACVSNDGKVSVFDLNVNKYRPICNQPIVSKRKNKLTRLDFNHNLPFLIVGDEKGIVHTLKLSPNLRLRVKPNKKQLHLTSQELEMMKLEKLLSFVREPAVLTHPKEANK